jgi:hypothetical protein
MIDMIKGIVNVVVISMNEWNEYCSVVSVPRRERCRKEGKRARYLPILIPLPWLKHNRQTRPEPIIEHPDIFLRSK